MTGAVNGVLRGGALYNLNAAKAEKTQALNDVFSRRAAIDAQVAKQQTSTNTVLTGATQLNADNQRRLDEQKEAEGYKLQNEKTEIEREYEKELKELNAIEKALEKQEKYKLNDKSYHNPENTSGTPTPSNKPQEFLA